MKVTKTLQFIFTFFAIMHPSMAQAEGGMGVGVATSDVGKDSKIETPRTVFFEIFGVGSNPNKDDKMSRYGSTQVRLEYSGKGTNPDGSNKSVFGFSSRGLGGWQILGKKNNPGFHLGIEPLNFVTQLNSNLITDAKNYGTRKAAQEYGVDLSSFGPEDINDPRVQQILKDPRVKQYLDRYALTRQLGNPLQRTNKQQFIYYMPMLSAGWEVMEDKCRILALARGGAALGASLIDDDYTAKMNLALGVGAYANCRNLNVMGEFTRIMHKQHPVDMVNAEVMYQPFAKVPLAAALSTKVIATHDIKRMPEPKQKDVQSDTQVAVETQGSVRVTW